MKYKIGDLIVSKISLNSIRSKVSIAKGCVGIIVGYDIRNVLDYKIFWLKDKFYSCAAVEEITRY